MKSRASRPCPPPLLAKLYKPVFWTGYVFVLLSSGFALPWKLDRFHLGMWSVDIRLDHLLHFGAYFLVALYFGVGSRLGFVLFKKRPVWQFIGWVLLLASVTEVVQLFVPTRAFNPVDWLANVTGLAAGLAATHIGTRQKGQV